MEKVNMGKNLQAALEQAAGRKGSQPVAAVLSHRLTSNETEPTPTPAKASSRAGKVHIGAYLSPDFKRSLLLVRAATGKSEQDLLATALNDLFRAHNVPVVDHN
jgi:hypothetical protein